MVITLSDSVGLRGHNTPADVKAVQALLNQHRFACGQEDGLCGKRTVQAIIAFQASFLRAPDGKIDPAGKTLAKLNEPGRNAPPPPPTDGSLTRLVAAPVKSAINDGLTPVTNAVITRLLGAPRSDYAADCKPLTNVRLARNLLTASVGPFRVSGLAPAVKSLSLVMAEIQRMQPNVYAVLGTADMLCCRFVRGSTNSISNHSWGTAVDLTLNGVLDQRGDGKVQYGLTLIAPVFNRFGWYWGATFKTEDGMHFEASQESIKSWTDQLA